MERIEELNDLMVELIDNIDAEKQVFRKRAREIIEEVSDFAEKSTFYKEQTEKHKEEMEWTKHESAWVIYIHMLQKIVDAPTTIHRDGSVILLMPILRKKLREEKWTDVTRRRERMVTAIKPICEVFGIVDYDYLIDETGREALKLNDTYIGCSGNSESAVVDELIGYIFIKRYCRNRSLGAFDKQTKNYIKRYWLEEGAEV